MAYLSDEFPTALDWVHKYFLAPSPLKDGFQHNLSPWGHVDGFGPQSLSKSHQIAMFYVTEGDSDKYMPTEKT